jgi:uncharacterized membrane protein YdjX (TVP38/TMEM64 family)
MYKLPGSRRSAPGWEWIIWRKLPWITIGGLALIITVAGSLHYFAPDGRPEQVAKYLLSVRIFAVASAILLITTVVTVAIGCIVVWIMKGPAYGSDGIELPDARAPDRPKRPEDS